MATIQVRVDDDIKAAADSLFMNLGMDTSTAIRMFLSASLARDGLPFAVKKRKPNAYLLEAIQDARGRHNLQGPFKTEMPQKNDSITDRLNEIYKTDN